MCTLVSQVCVQFGYRAQSLLFIACYKDQLKNEPKK